MERIKTEFPIMNPKRIGAIVSAYTGVLCGSKDELLKYAEELIGCPIYNDDFEGSGFQANLKALAEDDFKKLHQWCGGNENGR